MASVSPSYVDEDSSLDRFFKSIRAGRYGLLEMRLRRNPLYTLFVVSITLYAVFADDIRNAFFTNEVDYGVNAVLFLCFAVFVIDISLSVVFEPHYTQHVIFLLDLVATASMLVQSLLANQSGSAGLALARIARLVRVMRIMRVSKFTNAATAAAVRQAQKKRQEARTASNSITSMPTGYTGPLPSEQPIDSGRSNPAPSNQAKAGVMRSLSERFSQKKDAKHTKADADMMVKNRDPEVMSSVSTSSAAIRASNGSMVSTIIMQKTTEKLILLVLILVLGINLIVLDTSDQATETKLVLLDDVFPFFNSTGCFQAANAMSNSNVCVLASCCQGWNDALVDVVASLGMGGEAPTFRYILSNGILFLNDPTSDLRITEKSSFNSPLTSVIVDIAPVVRGVAMWSFLQTIVIMLVLIIFPYLFGQDVLRLVITPLEVIFDRVQSIVSDPFNRLEVTEMKTSKTYELDMIKESLTRLTKLLQVGLGQAGTDIISRNLQSGTFSVLVPGNRLDAIFGFCYIRDFNDCCEALQEDCVLFVNTVASIVSEAVSYSRGAVNKNLGDAFLLVWKWEDDPLQPTTNNLHLDSNQAAEAALRACVKVLRRIAKSDNVQDFASNPKVQKRLGSKYRVTMGFGLHIGWAIEGAVGSNQKIDATYLSPTVNIAARLETATHQYGVDILMSHFFYDQLGEFAKQKCRKVDRVALKGSNAPVELITYEFGENAKEVVKRGHEYYDHYVQGNWSKCKESLEAFRSTYPDDGPAETLWEYLKTSGFVAPPDWAGYRKLTSK